MTPQDHEVKFYSIQFGLWLFNNLSQSEMAPAESIYKLYDTYLLAVTNPNPDIIKS
jgi:hypothetical protein